MKKLLLAALASLVTTVSSQAVYIVTPLPIPSPGQWTGNQTANLTPAEITAIVGGSLLTLAYTQNVGGAESGPFASSYETTFSMTPSDPMNALVDYISGLTIPGQVFLYVKDGSQEPAFYIFDITAWNRTEDLQILNFWPAQGAISHISILYREGTTVPDGGATVMLLGAALTGLGFVRRFVKS